MNTDLLRQWLDLDERKRELTDQLEDVKKQLTNMQDAVKQEFAEAAVQRIHLDGRTIHLVCDRWARAKNGNKAGLIEALKANDLGQFVKEDFNLQSLRGLTNEMIRVYESELSADERAVFDVNDAIPESLRPYLEVTETYTVRSKAS